MIKIGIWMILFIFIFIFLRKKKRKKKVIKDQALTGFKSVISIPTSRWVRGMCPTSNRKCWVYQIRTTRLLRKAVWNQQSEMQEAQALGQDCHIPGYPPDLALCRSKSLPQIDTTNVAPFTAQEPSTEPFHSSAQIGPYIFEEWPPD